MSGGMCSIYKMVLKVYFDLDSLSRDWLPDIRNKVLSCSMGYLNAGR